MADRLGVETIDREGRTVVLKFRPQAKIDPSSLVTLVAAPRGSHAVPPASLKLEHAKRPSRAPAVSPQPISPQPCKRCQGRRQVEDRAQLVDGAGDARRR